MYIYIYIYIYIYTYISYDVYLNYLTSLQLVIIIHTFGCESCDTLVDKNVIYY